MLIGLLRRIPGYVSFCASGGFPERFLNLCKLSGITLWDVQNDGVKITGFTSIADYKTIRPVAKRSGMRVRLSGKFGLPFVLNRRRNRVGLAIGALLAAAFLVWMSGMIWNIEIVGNSAVKADDLRVALRENGVYLGAPKSKIDTETVEEALLADFQELNWVSLNRYGGKLLLEIRENAPKPRVPLPNDPVNLVAKKDGLITLVNGYSGTNLVKKGNTVKAGDLLVSGVLTNQDGSETLTRASGKVFALTENKVTLRVPFRTAVRSITATRERYRVFLFGLRVPLFFRKAPKADYLGEHLLRGGQTDLPLGLQWEVSYLFQAQELQLSTQEAGLFALLEGTLKLRELTKEVKADSCKAVLRENADGVSAILSVRGTENIAEEKAFYSDILPREDSE